MSVPAKVSVIIPNYNHFQYLPQRIESVLNQSFSDIEVIILDDCSHDASRELILKYASQDSRIKYVFNAENSKSVFKQWAKGLKIASGEYIWIAESDDFAEPDFLASLVSILEDDSHLVFAYCNSTVVNEIGENIGKISNVKQRIFNTDYWEHDYSVDGINEIRQYLSLQCTVNNASAVLFRRSSIDAVGGVDTSFRYAGDWLMYIKLSLQGKIAYHARCLNNYREHEANASKKSFGDGSQLFERQKCFAYVFKSRALDSASYNIMMQQASLEYLELQYLLISRLKQRLRMIKIASGISGVSLKYYVLIQWHALTLTNTWKRIISA